MDGNTVKIKSISVISFSGCNPEAKIEYTYKTNKGKTGTESNTLAAFKKMFSNL